MADVHATAIVDPAVKLADEVRIGPGCVLAGDVTLGAGCVLIGNVYLQGPLTMGAGNVVYPFSCLGFAPQDLGWNRAKDGAGLEIGEGNTFREHVTIHRATKDEPTRIGDRNYFMADSHAGHDCQIGSDNILANGTLLAGHVHVADRIVFGGGATVHQFCRIGRGAMLSGGVAISRDLPPFFMLTGSNIAGSINLIGLRRRGFSQDQIADVRWVYRTLYRQGMSINRATEVLRERADRPLVAEYIAFIEASSRGICPAVGKAVRGAAT